jgi:hypothetical protein
MQQSSSTLKEQFYRGIAQPMIQSALEWNPFTFLDFLQVQYLVDKPNKSSMESPLIISVTGGHRLRHSQNFRNNSLLEQTLGASEHLGSAAAAAVAVSLFLAGFSTLSFSACQYLRISHFW